jgi:PAX-interacting protein 1
MGSMRKGSKGLSEQREELLKVDELLHARLWQLQHMDKQYSSLLITQNDEDALNKANASIQFAEESFRKSIDSIDRIGKQYDDQAGTNDFQNITTFFKTTLENRRFLAYARLGLLSEKKGSAGYALTVLKLQDEIDKKDKIIAGYEATNNDQEKNAMRNAIAEKDKQVGELQSQLQKLQEEKQLYTETAQKLQTEIEQKNKIIETANKKLPADQKLVQTLQTDVAEKNKQIGTLQAQLKKEQSDKQMFAQSVQKLQNEVVEKNKLIAAEANKRTANEQKAMLALQNDINAKSNRIGTLETQLKKEQSDKLVYAQGMQRLQNEVNEKNKLITSLNRKSPIDQKTLVSLQTQVNERNKKISALEAQLKKEQTDKQAYAQSIQKLQNEVADKNKLLASANSKAPIDQKTLANLQTQINEKNKRISTLESQIKKEQSDRQAYAQSVQKLQSEIVEKNKLIASANKRPASTTDQKVVQTLQNDIAARDQRIRALEDQLKQTQTRTVAYKPEDATSLKDLQQKNNNLKLAYNNSLAQLDMVVRKYNALKSENDQLRSRLR